MSVTVLHEDCRVSLGRMADASADAVVTDPPYALVSIVKRFGKPGAAAAKHGSDGLYARASSGFMGQAWDTGETAFDPAFWAEVLRVLKPGGHVVSFGGTRTYHRMACAIEDGGFEIRDQIGWAYGSGFPKSHKQKGDWQGWGTALKPAWEPIALARKPLIGTVAENVVRFGTGALNIAGCRIGDGVRSASYTSLAPCKSNGFGAAGTAEARRGTQSEPQEYVGRWPANFCHDGSDDVVGCFPETESSLPGHRDSKFIPVASDYRHAHRSKVGHIDRGSAARFFYTAKADADDRWGSKHPTVKPVDLMRWLVRLVTPPGGVVLDPFAGSGTTGVACLAEGMSAILCEREAEFIKDIELRLAHAAGTGAHSASVKARHKRDTDNGPLFGGAI